MTEKQLNAKIEEMIKFINEELKLAKMYFDWYHENDQRYLDRIHGAMEMLNILTDNAYQINYTAVKVEKKN